MRGESKEEGTQDKKPSWSHGRQRSARRLQGETGTHQQRICHLRDNVYLGSGSRVWSRIGAHCGETIQLEAPGQQSMPLLLS